ncbi:MAG: hypothetical protein QOH56_4045 [Pseudonocardiales bacterium]|jgi:hypothetical protein|nr:hypothetical protein [Pseudonocardiales bacterium]
MNDAIRVWSVSPDGSVAVLAPRNAVKARSMSDCSPDGPQQRCRPARCRVPGRCLCSDWSARLGPALVALNPPGCVHEDRHDCHRALQPCSVPRRQLMATRQAMAAGIAIAHSAPRDVTASSHRIGVSRPFTSVAAPCALPSWPRHSCQPGRREALGHSWGAILSYATSNRGSTPPRPRRCCRRSSTPPRSPDGR